MIIPISRQTPYCDIVDMDMVNMEMVDMDMDMEDSDRGEYFSEVNLLQG